jgi:hypothetical protein
MRTLALAVLATALTTLPSYADSHNDAEACKPDVFRLCSAHIPWRDRITSCLRENKRKLSPACYQVFNRRPAKPGKSEPPAAVVRYEPGTLQ